MAVVEGLFSIFGGLFIALGFRIAVADILAGIRQRNAAMLRAHELDAVSTLACSALLTSFTACS